MITASAARLARIPLVDIRGDGPVRHAIEGRARARALRDECIPWLPRVAAGNPAGTVASAGPPPDH